MKPRRSAAICGKANGESLLAAEGVRRADMFLTRLRPDTTDTGVVDLITKTFPMCISVKVEKLETRFDTYASFRIELFAFSF